MIEAVSVSGSASHSGSAGPSLLRPLQEATELLVGWSVADVAASGQAASPSPTATASDPIGAFPPAGLSQSPAAVAGTSD